jgi:hypothetical protein
MEAAMLLESCGLEVPEKIFTKKSMTRFARGRTVTIALAAARNKEEKVMSGIEQIKESCGRRHPTLD